MKIKVLLLLFLIGMISCEKEDIEEQCLCEQYLIDYVTGPDGALRKEATLLESYYLPKSEAESLKAEPPFMYKIKCN